MKKVLVAYFTVTGTTEKMANYIAEGVRFSGNQAVVRKVDEVKEAGELNGYDGYIFGSPTFSLNVPGQMKAFLSFTEKAKLEGKMGGSFGSYRHDISYQHDSFAPAIILDSMQKQNRVKPFELGALSLKEDLIETRDGIKACQDYGKAFGTELGS